MNGLHFSEKRGTDLISSAAFIPRTWDWIAGARQYAEGRLWSPEWNRSGPALLEFTTEPSAVQDKEYGIDIWKFSSTYVYLFVTTAVTTTTNLVALNNLHLLSLSTKVGILGTGLKSKY